jgi:hypothetical protein
MFKIVQKGFEIVRSLFIMLTRESRLEFVHKPDLIENECYIAKRCTINFTPCDFASPANAIKAEATPNTEMILIAVVDLL